MTAQSNTLPQRPPWFSLILLGAVTLAARLIWWAVLPQNAMSVDLHDWPYVVKALNAGVNPYSGTLLNWPPFWMEMLYGLSRFSLRFNVDFISAVRVCLVMADLAVLCALSGLMRALYPKERHGWVILWGYALNPVFALLTIQHGNFDAFAMIWVLLSMQVLVRYDRSGDPVDWLLACACVGIGGFTKTFPLLLWPILASGARRTELRGKLLGIILVAMPAALSLLPLFVLSPAGITEHVLKYRSMGSSFGILSLLDIFHANEAIEIYRSLFAILFPILLAVLAAIFWRRGMRPTDVPLIGGLILLGAFTLGSGYGPQYWFWPMPVFLAFYPASPRWFRRVLCLAAIVIVATNVFEYAVEVTPLGGFWIFWFPSSSLIRFSQNVPPQTFSLIRLPMTLVSLSVIVCGTFVAINRIRSRDINA